MNFECGNEEELRQIWQSQSPQQISEEVQRTMQFVESKTRSFDRTIYWRNAREYVAAAIVCPLFGFWAYHAQGSLEKAGLAIISVSALWIIGFMLWKQRPGLEPDPLLALNTYQESLLAKYDRQASLLRTAGLWYVLPLTAGSVVARYGADNQRITWHLFAMIGFGVVLWLANYYAAKKIVSDRNGLEQMMRSGQ